jgi:predicted nucleotidyltransferase
MSARDKFAAKTSLPLSQTCDRVSAETTTKSNVICIMISLRIIMQLEEIKKKKQQLYQIAAKCGISRIDVFGSVARGESKPVSDIDFLIEMDENVSALGVGAFQYEVQQLLGIKIDVIPTFALQNIEDQAFVRSVRSDSVAI